MYVTNIKYLESVNRHFYFHINTKHTHTHSLSEMLLRIIYFILSKRVCTFHHHHHQHACIAMYKTHIYTYRYYYLMMTRAEHARSKLALCVYLFNRRIRAQHGRRSEHAHTNYNFNQRNFADDIRTFAKLSHSFRAATAAIHFLGEKVAYLCTEPQ